MHIVLFDTPKRSRFYPLTLTRAIGDIRLGILTIKERWEHLTNQKIYLLTEPTLQPLYGDIPGGDCLLIDATLVPTKELVNKILELNNSSYICDNEGFIAGRLEIDKPTFGVDIKHFFSKHARLILQRRLEYPHQIFQWNDEFLRSDFSLVISDRSSATHPSSTHIQNKSEIFFEDETSIASSILNTSSGPIYVGKNVTIMEGCMLRGPIALCEGTTVKMGAMIYGATTAGPNCVIGGEIKNSIFFGNSNKAHDGYIGDSVIGEWCNLGAGTSNSNVKNTAGEVKQWNYFANSYIPVGTKCGMIMGDYSTTAINTSINTGTMIGVCANVFGHGLSPKVIPDFSWGMHGDVRYEYDKAIESISNWKKMKKELLTDHEIKVVKNIFEKSKM